MLNKAQRKAISHFEGPMLVISGAGTGKTHVLTSRICALLEKGVLPSEILALTFTEKAANEMLERVEKTLPLGHEEIWIKTFHAFAESILRERGIEIGISPDYKLLDTASAWLFLKQHVLDLKLDYYRSSGNPQKFLRLLQDHFSRLQDEDISPEAYETYGRNFSKKAKTPEEKENASKMLELARAYAIYEDLLLKNDYLDFSGLLYYMLRLFEKRPSVLEYYQKRFRFILVDEFQDTNFSQNKLITLLSKAERNLFVVGDDDQSIYKWRGASLTNIEYFNKLFPEAKKIILVDNYRSSQAILDAAYAVIQKNNPNRLEVTLCINKKLRAATDAKNHIPEVWRFSGVEDEVKAIVSKAQNCLAKKMNTAILIRTNALAKPFLEELKKEEVPFQHFSRSGFFEKPGVKDCIALLRVIENPWDDIALFRFLSIPFWKIPMERLLELNRLARKNNRSLYEVLDGSHTLHIKQLLQKLIEYSRGNNVSEVLRMFLQKSAYLQDPLNESTIDDIALLSEKVSAFERTHEYKKASDFLHYLELLEESGGESEPEVSLDATAIKVLTIHAAKGLEFDAVLVPALVQNKFPTTNRREALEIPEELIPEPLPKGDHHLEEERRLFYVACTRARETLILSYSDFYESKRQWKPSIFIAELLESGKAILKNFAKNASGTLNQTSLEVGERPHKKLRLNIPKLSYSQLETFRTCPLKYQFRYLWNLPSLPSPHLSFGASIHNTLRDFFHFLKENKSEETELLPLLETLYKKNWIAAGYENKALHNDQKERGEKLLKRFYQKEKNGLVIPAFIEKSFTLDLGEITLTGRIDRIDEMPDGTYEVIDYKTGENSEKNLKKDLQLSIYALACREVLKIPVARLTLYYLDSLEKISTTRTDKELDFCRDEIIECAKEIAASDFSPTPGYHCRYCDYRLVCPAAVAVSR